MLERGLRLEALHVRLPNMDLIAPCPLCDSMRVEPKYITNGFSFDPGCCACGETRPLPEWIALVKRGPLDTPVAAECVNMDDRDDVEWWCKELGVDSATLGEAVSTVGPMGKAVRFWFSSQCAKLKKV